MSHAQRSVFVSILVVVLSWVGYADTLTGLNLVARPGVAAGQDMFIVQGTTGVSVAQFDQQAVTVGVGPYTTPAFTPTRVGTLPIFIYRGSGAGVTLALFNLSSHRFVVLGQRVSLAGISNPVNISLTAGGYQGTGQFNLPANTNFLAFNRGTANNLSVTTFTYLPGSTAGTDRLTVNGRITTNNPAVNLASQAMFLNFGSFSTMIPGGGFVRSSPEIFMFVARTGFTGPVQNATFDFAHSTFTLSIPRAAIAPQTSPAGFRVAFGTFDMTVPLTFTTTGGGGTTPGLFTVIGYNDLGMHCMNQDFSEFMILPPYNTLHAQVIRRGGDPRIVTSGVSVEYALLNNTTSSNKTNFWDYVNDLLGVNLAQNVGLAGLGLSGNMTATAAGDWKAEGIPVTPLNDQMQLDPYPLARIQVKMNGVVVGATEAVVPVSWEINCNLCHGVTAPGILEAHDALHGTQHVQNKPVLCGECHAQAPLGLAGDPEVPSLSRAMHHSHAGRMGPVLAQLNNNACYACHPGVQTQCLRDVHAGKGMNCTSCHGDMTAVANPARQPWVTEPTCGGCHAARRPTFEFEQANTQFRNSRGHHGVHCSACHNSPHAITPTTTARDNAQTLALQGHTGPINKCSVCHTSLPEETFDHRFGGGD